MGFPLPPELIQIVLEFIIADENANVPPYVTQSTNLAPYATVNRDWQAIIESQTFSSIKIDTNKRLAEFKQLPWDQLSWSQRRSHIRKIHFIVELESYDGEARTRYENEEEIQRNSKAFTTSIQSLFNALSEWSDNEAGISLSIMAQSPGDISAQGPEAMKQRGWGKSHLLTDDIGHKRYDRSYLQFNEEAVGAQCRAVPIITRLDIIGAMGHRKLEPASSSLIASKLPRLHDLYLTLDDNCKWDSQLRERRRNEFADSSQFLPLTIRVLSFGFAYITPEDENYPPAASTVEGNTDPLSSRLREFSQQLTVMGGNQCVLGKELFWPLNDYIPITPCGKWMFEQDNDAEEPDYDSDGLGSYYDDMDDTDLDWVPPEDRKCRLFRTKFVHELFNQYYLSAGKAALRMPKLDSMLLDVSHRPQHRFWYQVENEMAKVTWSSEDDPKAFEPSEEVLQIWNQVALEHTGNGLEVEFQLY
ncbi:hypothetical protein N7471_006909 [Penicillium samsonianum]|uniref:uncharacterized protein n=1 Tax=Penicillium samsonianum TaxID=1882272 RepID=UPI0025477A81|nr:uncharacterized protein N7471_006909 [Penicillium samsonianum]KAJ6131694.1 hypothetical protein N7471_006909 [Penicillium samsonianum]